ncbi:MAG: hypothetical protein WCL30_01355 [Pseudomonadota bacterium]
MPLSQISQNGNDFKFEDKPIIPIYTQAIEKAVELFRKNQIEKFGITVAAIDKTIGGKPQSELGEEAAEWHKKALSIAENMLPKWQQDTSATAGITQGKNR